MYEYLVDIQNWRHWLIMILLNLIIFICLYSWVMLGTIQHTVIMPFGQPFDSCWQQKVSMETNVSKMVFAKPLVATKTQSTGFPNCGSNQVHPRKTNGWNLKNVCFKHLLTTTNFWAGRAVSFQGCRWSGYYTLWGLCLRTHLTRYIRYNRVFQDFSAYLYAM